MKIDIKFSPKLKAAIEKAAADALENYVLDFKKTLEIEISNVKLRLDILPDSMKNINSEEVARSLELFEQSKYDYVIKIHKSLEYRILKLWGDKDPFYETKNKMGL